MLPRRHHLAVLLALVYGAGALWVLSDLAPVHTDMLHASAVSGEPEAVTYNQLVTLSREGQLVEAILSSEGVRAVTAEGATVQAYHRRDPYLAERLEEDGATVSMVSDLHGEPVSIWVWLASVAAGILVYLLAVRFFTARRSLS